jgi:hypothetical protein
MPPCQSQHPLELAVGDWASLPTVVHEQWHELTHARAGRQRPAHVQLCLTTDWRCFFTGAQPPACVHALAEHLAQGGTKVEVLIVASGHPAELRVRWVSWHDPPTASLLPPWPPSLCVTPPSSHSGDSVMSLFNFFNKTTQAKDYSLEPHMPKLDPQPLASQRHGGAQLPLALSQMAEHIVRQEVHDLLELGMKARYRLTTLSFHVSAANQPALRNLMEVNQRNPAAARQVVHNAFAKSASAALLDTRRLALLFTPGEQLPRDAAEVLVVCGRDTVALPYTYSGEIELPNEADSLAPSDARGAAALHQGPGAAAVASVLYLWLQTAEQPVAKRWRIAQSSTVGAARECDIQVDWPRVSGQHLVLAPDAQGLWTVRDDKSTNGSLCLDAEHASGPGNPAEMPLLKAQTHRLPRAGCLRLGSEPADPLLHFAQLETTHTRTVPAPSARASRRVTDPGPAIAHRDAHGGLDLRTHQGAKP